GSEEASAGTSRQAASRKPQRKPWPRLGQWRNIGALAFSGACERTLGDLRRGAARSLPCVPLRGERGEERLRVSAPGGSGPGAGDSFRSPPPGQASRGPILAGPAGTCRQGRSDSDGTGRRESPCCPFVSFGATAVNGFATKRGQGRPVSLQSRGFRCKPPVQ